jgi:hypothetical protein
VDGNLQEDITVLGGQTKWFLDKEVPEPIKTLCVIMQDTGFMMLDTGNQYPISGIQHHYFYPDALKIKRREQRVIARRRKIK